MFKLVTEQEKQKIWREYVRRRSVVIIISLISILVIGIIGLLPSYILSSIRYSETLELSEIIEGAGVKEEESSFQAWFVETNRRLTALSPGSNVDRPSDFIKKVLDQKTNNISILNFSWKKVDGKVTSSISGIASDRQSLVTFRDNLISSGDFSGVDLPVSDLAKDKDIDFQIKFSPL